MRRRWERRLRADESLTLQALLDAFSAGCPSQGQWTRLALSQTRILVETLKTLKDDPDCQSLAGSVSSLISIDQGVSDYEARFRDQTRLEQLRSLEQLLSDQLTDPLNQSATESLRGQLRQVQLDLTTLGVEERRDQERKLSERSAAIRTAVLGTQSLLQQALSNQACLIKRPGILTGVVGLGASISAAAMITNPALGLGLAGGTKLLGELVEASRKDKIAKRIRKLNRDTAMKAMSCALESLSNQYCVTEDALRVLQLRDQARQEPAAGGSLSTAVRLFDREIPALLTWLEKVRLGTDPKTRGDANRREEILKRQAQAGSSRGQGLALLAERTPIYDSLTSDEDRLNFIRALIGTFVGGLYGTSGANAPIHPFFDVIPSNFSYYYLLGFSANNIPLANGQWKNITEISLADLATAGITLSLTNFETRLKTWSDRAIEYVNRELALVMQPDALGLMSEAIERSRDGIRVRPVVAASNIATFLKENRPRDFEFGSFESIYDDQQKRLEAIVSEITQALAPGGASYAPTAVSRIYDIAQLNFGLLVFNNRFELVTRLALFELFSDADPALQDLALAFLSSERLIEHLAEINPQKSIIDHREDMTGAQTVTLGSIDEFVKIYGKPIREVLEHYREREQNLPGAASQYYRMDRTRLCLKLLSATKWPKDVPQSLCLGLQLAPAQIGAPASILISPELLMQPHEQRACSYRGFIESSIVFEKTQALGLIRARPSPAPAFRFPL